MCSSNRYVFTTREEELASFLSRAGRLSFYAAVSGYIHQLNSTHRRLHRDSGGTKPSLARSRGADGQLARESYSSKLPALTAFKLEHSDQITNEGLRALSSASHLKALKLARHTYKLTDEAVRAVSSPHSTSNLRGRRGGWRPAWRPRTPAADG